jgi:hypothetical protein
MGTYQFKRRATVGFSFVLPETTAQEQGVQWMDFAAFLQLQRKQLRVQDASFTHELARLCVVCAAVPISKQQ